MGWALTLGTKTIQILALTLGTGGSILNLKIRWIIDNIDDNNDPLLIKTNDDDLVTLTNTVHVNINYRSCMAAHFLQH